jgi:CRISPR-associated protein Csx1
MNTLYPSPLSSISLKRYFNNNATLVLIYPVSIVYNENALQSLKNDPFAINITANISNYLADPKMILKDHPHNVGNEFLVVHSLGEYTVNRLNVNVDLKASYDDIVLEILLDMIKRYLEKKDEKNEFYVDISSGHNIYVAALLEAVKHFSVFSQLMKWQNKDLRPAIYITFSDPILGSSASHYQIYIQPIEFKALFSSPVKKDDIDLSSGCRLSYRYFKDKEEIKKRLDEILNQFGIVFSAIKNNTPLALYHYGYHNPGEIIDILKRIIKDIEDELSKDWKQSPNLLKDSYLKIILSLGFYAGIVEVLESNKIQKYDKSQKYGEEGVALNEIKEKFGSAGNSIYEIFNLHTHVSLLGYEIHKLQHGKGQGNKTLIERAGETWEKLGKYFEDETSDFSDLNERNFLAHTGFERTVTEVRKMSDKLYVRYSLGEKTKNKIESFLKKYM